MTKFWTFQRKEIYSALNNEGILLPDFSTAKTITSMEEGRITYLYVLDQYNKACGTDYKGLVFGITGGYGHSEITSPEDLYDIIIENGYPSGTYFEAETHVLLEVEIPDDIHILKLDFYRFTDVMWAFDEGSDKEREDFLSALYLPNGQDGAWELIQAHVPFIKKEWIKSVHIPKELICS